MKTTYIIYKNGSIISQSEPINFDASKSYGFSGFRNQITLEFFNDVIALPGGNFEPDYSTNVVSGMSGMLNIEARGSEYSPFSTIQDSPLDISNTFNAHIESVVQSLQFNSSNIVGCNYIRIIYYYGG